MSQPMQATLTDVNGKTLLFSSPTLGTFIASPLPILLTDSNGNPITLTGTSAGVQYGAPLPVVICNAAGYAYTLPFTVTSNGSDIVVSSSVVSRTTTLNGQPIPVVLTDLNGNALTISGVGVGSFIGAPQALLLCDSRGYPITVSVALGTNGFLLEDGSGVIVLEDGTSILLQEV